MPTEKSTSNTSSDTDRIIAVGKVVKRLQEKQPEYADKIPRPVLHALQYYVAGGSGVGHFLSAVLTNDLFGVKAHADLESWANLRELIDYIYNHLPGPCWGSRKKMEEWQQQGGIAGGAVPLTDGGDW
jgi:hypothetical protein